MRKSMMSESLQSVATPNSQRSQRMPFTAKNSSFLNRKKKTNSIEYNIDVLLEKDIEESEDSKKSISNLESDYEQDDNGDQRRMKTLG